MTLEERQKLAKEIEESPNRQYIERVLMVLYSTKNVLEIEKDNLSAFAEILMPHIGPQTFGE